MKINFHYHFYSRLLISLLFFGLGIFLLNKSVPSTALVYENNDVEIGGWAWSDKAGWISLNCLNDFDGDGKLENTCITNDYKLKVTNVSNQSYIQGCAWAGGVPSESIEPDEAPGWICFSNPGGGHLALASGVPVNRDTYTVNTSNCNMNSGVCTINNNIACYSHTDCESVNGYCNLPILEGTCLGSPLACNDDGDCTVAGGTCVGGFCSGALEPGFCYVDQQCASGECYHPYWVGVCHNDPSIVCQQNSTCSPSYCEYDINSWRDTKTCNPALNGSDCGFGVLPHDPLTHSCITTSVETKYHENILDINSYASILKLEGETSLSYRLEFPMDEDSKLNKNAKIGTYAYDPDNPALIENNPIQGCFNCEEIRKGNCANAGISCNQNNAATVCDVTVDNSCQGGTCVLPPNQPCTNDDQCADSIDYCIYTDIEYNCDNCLEYFYYNDEVTYRCSLAQWILCGPTAPCSLGNCVPFQNNRRCSNDNLIFCNTQEDCGYVSCRTNNTCADDNSPCNVDADCGYIGSCVTKPVGALDKVLAGYNCSDCIFENINNSCSLNAYNNNLNRCSVCESVFKTTGVILDNKNDTIEPQASILACQSSETLPDDCPLGALCGWAKNVWWADGRTYGLGWIQFSPRITTSTNPYFSVEKGNIYSKGNISSKYYPPFRKYNASYLIEAGGGISNFISSSTIADRYQGELSQRPLIDFLSQVGLDTKYRNILGSLDYTGLTTMAEQQGASDYNKYGSEILKFVNNVDFGGTITTSDGSGFREQFNNPLNNKVLYVAKNNNGRTSLFIQNALTIKPGNLSTSGTGIIIVDGNLHINQNIVYDASAGLTNLRQIPSVVWIVRGDIKVDPNVTNIAGTFIALGKVEIENCSAGAEGCGRFISSFSVSGDLGNKLVVSGNVLAKKFLLQRTYANANTTDPAEQFINDGRLQANPPGGLEDLSKVIPRFSSF